jgi:alkylation response protein AidB-like acyl-CoA dehydrogenase
VDNATTSTKSPAKPKQLATHGPGETGWLTSAEVAALTPEIVRARITALKPLVAAHAAESEELGYPHPVVWDAIRATGFFYHFVPKIYGGCEFGPEDFFLTARIIAEDCASTAWAATFLVEHSWIAALYPKQAQDIFFAKGRYIMAPAVSTPPAKAVRAPGGFRVTGQWRYGSGVMHSDWCMGMAMIEGENPPVACWLAFPLSEAQVLDTWHVAGLRATGSNDILVNDVFVPEHMVVYTSDLQSGTTPGATLHANPMYRMPSTSFLALVTSTPAIGAARGAVKLFHERLKTRKITGTQMIAGEKPTMHLMLGRAETMVRTAEMLFEDVIRNVHDMAKRDDLKNSTLRMEIVAQNAYASHLARDALRLMIDNSGSSVHYSSDPMQRLMRDTNVVCAHLIQDLEVLTEQYGRSLLGMPPLTPFF